MANAFVVYPIGEWIALTPVVWTGFSADPTSTFQYTLDGKRLLPTNTISGNGTSNATTLTLQLPFTAAVSYIGLALVTNNGTVQTGRMNITAGSNLATFFATPAGGAFTAAGSKAAYLPGVPIKIQ